MELPEEALKKGRITIYKDTPFELVKAAEEYNEHLTECRKKSKLAEETVFGYLVMNMVLIPVISVLVSKSVFAIPASILLILLNIFCSIYFSLFKKELLLSTVCAALLVIIDILYFPLVTADFILFFMHRHITGELKKEPGYPAFAEFQVHYDRRSTPTEQYEDMGGQD